MKVEYLLECYRYHNICYKSIDEESIITSDDKIFIINFDKHVKAVCCKNSEIVYSIRIVADWGMGISNYNMHTLNVFNIIRTSINCLSNISHKEINIIFSSLGLYDGTFVKGKKIKNYENLYKIEVIDGILVFTIAKL